MTLHETLTEKIGGYLDAVRRIEAFHERTGDALPNALIRARFRRDRWEAEKRVLDRHEPLDWWVLFDEKGERLEPTEERRQPTLCRACTDLRDEDFVVALEAGDEVDLGASIVQYPCVEVRDLAARCGVEVPA